MPYPYNPNPVPTPEWMQRQQMLPMMLPETQGGGPPMGPPMGLEGASPQPMAGGYPGDAPQFGPMGMPVGMEQMGPEGAPMDVPQRGPSLEGEEDHDIAHSPRWGQMSMSEKWSHFDRMDHEQQRSFLGRLKFEAAMGRGEKVPDLKYTFMEGLAMALNPQLAGVIMRKKMQPFMDKQQEDRQKQQAIDELLRMSERQADQAGQGGFSLSPGQTRFDAEGAEIASVPIPEGQTGQPPRPMTVGPDQGLFDPATGKWIREPSRGTPGQAAIPRSVYGRLMDLGINPIQPGQPGYETFSTAIAAKGGELDTRLQAKALSLFNTVFANALKNIIGRKPKPEEEQAAADLAARSVQTLLKQFGGQAATAPGGTGRPSQDERFAELVAQGYSEEEAFKVMESEGY